MMRSRRGPIRVEFAHHHWLGAWIAPADVRLLPGDPGACLRLSPRRTWSPACANTSCRRGPPLHEPLAWADPDRILRFRRWWYCARLLRIGLYREYAPLFSESGSYHLCVQELGQASGVHFARLTTACTTIQGCRVSIVGRLAAVPDEKHQWCEILL